MKLQASVIAALGLVLTMSPAFASDWTVEFTNKSGMVVWVVGLDDDGAEVHDGKTQNVKWTENGCPIYSIGYFIVYDEEAKQEENTIVSVSYKYEQTKNSCKLVHYTNDWYNYYGDSYTAVDKGTNKNHKRKLTLKPK